LRVFRMAAKKGLKLRRISWEEAERLAENVALQAAKSGFKPDAVVGIGRGGWVPARVVADVLGIGVALSICIKYYESVGRTRGKPLVFQAIPREGIEGRRLLVVDDIADTGKSLRVALGLLSAARDVRVATLHFKPGSEVKPDFFAEKATEWIVYPWEKRETERDLRKKTLPEASAKALKQPP